MNLFAIHVLQTHDSISSQSKRNFIEAINTVQRTSFANEEQAKVEFDNTATTSFLLKNGVFQEKELVNDAHIIPTLDRPIIEESVNQALSLIGDVNINLLNLLNSVIGSISVYSIPERDGGSISNAIGHIWLSPLKEWDRRYYGEMLVHELIHNCVFLEDMVRTIMPNTNLLGVEDALSISAIRQTRRPYDKSFHSACVVTGIMYYYNQIGESERGLQYLPSLRNTVTDLQKSYSKLAEQNLFVLSPNGYDILNDLQTFSQDLDYSVFENSLSLS
ncbi:hypothetical protein [Ferruginibacter sp.]